MTMTNVIPFDYHVYGINGEPEHNTDHVFCWCAPRPAYDGTVIVHKDMIEVLSTARQLGRADAQQDIERAQDEFAAARSSVESELRAIAHFYGVVDGWAPLDSVSGMLSQISNIICGIVAQRDRAIESKAELVREIKELHERLAAENHEITLLMENLRETAVAKRAAELARADSEHLATQACLRADSAEAELRKLRDQVRAANDEIDRLKALLAPAASETYVAQVAQDGVEL